MRAKTLLTCLVAATFATVALAGPAAAHEHVPVADGKYELTVGWRVEPPYAGIKNGLDLRVERILSAPADDHGHGHGNESAGGHGHDETKKEVVAGLLANLTVTYEIAGKTFEPPSWRAQFGRPGWYTAEITPTREGDYTVHIVGDIEGHAIDVRVKPHTVEPLRNTMFPERDPTAEELMEQLSALQDEMTALKEKIAALETQEATEPTRQSATTATPPTARTPGPGLIAVAIAVALAAVVVSRPRR